MDSWWNRIERASLYDHFTNEDTDDAGPWYSCAVGECRNNGATFQVAKDNQELLSSYDLVMLINESSAVEPIDRELSGLGVRFVNAVRYEHDIEAARKAYLQIRRLCHMYYGLPMPKMHQRVTQEERPMPKLCEVEKQVA